MQENKELFIPALKKIMEEHNIKAPALAKKAGLTAADGKNLISFIAGKRDTFPIKKLESIFVAFGVEINVENNNK